MANQQHIEWLLEGVEKWNARRERDDFMPDFEGLDFVSRMSVYGLFDYLLRTGAKDNKNSSLVADRDLRNYNFQMANLSRANLSSLDLAGTDFRGANLEKAIGITQEQLDAMIGDSETRIPEGLKRPDHWPEFDAENSDIFALTDIFSRTDVFEPNEIAAPKLPERATLGNTITTSDGRLTLAIDPAPPQRSDLEAIYEEVKGSANDLRRLGNIGNMSAVMESALHRFLASIPENYADLEQVRFGVGAATLRLRFDGERADLASSAPEKIGHIEALLYAADLITARLPDWQAFLAEEKEERIIIADHVDEVDSLLEDAAEHLENAPDTFDPSIFQRIREYIDAKSIEGYLAGTDLLTNIAHKTFSLVLDLLKDTISETRKGVIKKIAYALQIELGAVLAKLAGILPHELQWLVNWLEFLPKIL